MVGKIGVNGLHPKVCSLMNHPSVYPCDPVALKTYANIRGITDLTGMLSGSMSWNRHTNRRCMDPSMCT
eukprot:2263145-Amphidinium_carterae.1